VTRAGRTGVLIGPAALPVAGHGVSTTVLPARTGHETSRSAVGGAVATAAAAAAFVAFPRRGSFGALAGFAAGAIAATAAAGETSVAAGVSGTTLGAAVAARLNGAQRRQEARTRFQQFGQTARAQDGHSRNGAIDSSPSWSRSRPHCSQNKAEDTPNPSIDARSPG
jgi:hypothetical protein